LKALVTIGAVVLIVLAAVASFGRNLVWQTNVTLLKDSVEQTPSNRMLRDVYMSALLNADKIDEAKEQYRIASGLRTTVYDERADIVMGGQLRKEGNYIEALHLYETALQRTKFSSETLLASALSLIQIMKTDSKISMEEQSRLDILELNYAQRMGRMTKTPDRLIIAGKVALEHGSLLEASSLFNAALVSMPVDDRRKKNVADLLNKAVSR
jgi:tetratricopeptide (TPR) repeat protein